MNPNDSNNVWLFDINLVNPVGMAMSSGAEKVLVASKQKILEFNLKGTLLRELPIKLHTLTSNNDPKPRAETFGYCGNDETIWWIEGTVNQGFELKSDGPELELPKLIFPTTEPINGEVMNRLEIQAADMSNDNEMVVSCTYLFQGNTRWTSVIFGSDSFPSFKSAIQKKALNLRWLKNGSKYFYSFKARTGPSGYEYHWLSTNDDDPIYGSFQSNTVKFTGSSLPFYGEQSVQLQSFDYVTLAFVFHGRVAIKESEIDIDVQMASPSPTIIDYDWR